MMPRRSFLTVLGAGVAAGGFGLSLPASHASASVASRDTAATPDPCRDEGGIVTVELSKVKAAKVGTGTGLINWELIL